MKSMKSIIVCVVLFIAVSLSFFSFGEEKEIDIEDISLVDLLNMKVTVASNSGATVRDSPGIITLITETEIKNSGARDLIDVLRLVPGFNFNMDVQNTVGVAIRGNWAHEGKVLLLIDGQEINEMAFATLQFGNHYPLEHISRIEIIRGPGSAIYGGFAELGVINIITKNADEINGISIGGTYGQMKSTFGRRRISVMVGKSIGDFKLTAHLLAGQGNRSDRDFSDFYGNTYNMKNNNRLDPTFLNLNLQYKDLGIRYIMDRYHTTGEDIYFVNAPYNITIDFKSCFFEIKNVFRCGSKFTLIPRLNYKRQWPWYSPGTTALDLEELDPDLYGGIFTHEVMERLLVNLTIAYDISEKANITGGFESFRDNAEDKAGNSYFGKNRINYHNFVFFCQGLLKTSIGNITLGARFEDHNEFGTSFVPRFALTRLFKRLHFKLLYSKAFRAPSIRNMNSFLDREGDPNARVKPENSSMVELEAGYQFTQKLFLTANLFDINIKDPIVYYYSGQDAYDNYKQTGTRGLEVELKLKDKWGYASMNYSFYKVNKNLVDQYAVEADPDMLLGFPAHKLVFDGSVKLGKNFSVNPSAVYTSHRYGYKGVDEDDNLILGRFDPVLWLNLYLRCKNLFVKGFDVGVGIYNLLDEKYSFIQPYKDGYHAPLPEPSREIIIRMDYSFNFK